MADYLEIEAEESDDDTIYRKQKFNKDADEDSEDEEQSGEDFKDLINDDEEDDIDDDEEDSQKKRKHHDDYDDALEDDDYDLLEENLGFKVNRKKKFKRLRRIVDEESDIEEEKNEREAIADELFEGDMDSDEVEPRVVEDTLGDMGESGEESDESDFIVDDIDQPITKGKKKKPIKYSNVALQEAQEIFGVDFDYGVFAQDNHEEEKDDKYKEKKENEKASIRQRKAASKQLKRKTLFDIFEPVELERSYMTDLDKEIRVTDVPERFMLRAVPVTKAEDEEIEEEAEWIYRQAFNIPTISIQEAELHGENHQPMAGRKNGSAVEKIKEALNFMRNSNYEVPFIAFYRKEYVEPDLNINDLWAVYKWDEKWCQLKTRKDNLTKLFEKMQQYLCDPDKPLAEEIRPLGIGDILRLQSAQSMEEVQDCNSHFMLYYGCYVPKMKEYFKKKHQEENEENTQEGNEQEDIKIKHASHTNAYRAFKNTGIADFAKKFGLTPEQFAENLRDNYQRHEIDQCPVAPLEMASDYVCIRFQTAEECLSAAKFMVATQIAREPIVKKYTRQIYFERSKIIVKPTPKGMKEIDENHPCYSMKYLTKSVKDLRGDQFLKLSMAEKNEELKITIAMSSLSEKDGHQVYLDEIKHLYERDEYSKHVLEWNSQRQQVLGEALTKILYPSFEKELRLRLMSEAKEGIIRACSRKLYNWLKIAPYEVDQQLEDEDNFDTREGVRVLSIAYKANANDIPPFCALVNGVGEVLEFIKLPYLLNRRNSYRSDDWKKKENNLNALKRIICDRKPHVIVVSGESRDAQMIVADVKRKLRELMDNEQFPPINVEIMNNELAEIYSKSSRGVSEFQDYPELLRQAISLARRIQDPLIEFSQLCTPDEEILCLKYHQLQGEVNKDDLLNALHLEFINRTNEIGVDLNRATRFSHTANTVQFVCGLGPRKGTHLIKVLTLANQQLESRTQLVTFCKMGPQVFVNCAGFIKIDISLIENTDNYVEVLDGSRIHPEAYEWAKKMAIDALEYEDSSEEINAADALDEILENPEKLKDLDLDAFAEELERQNFGSKSITLYDIRAELNHKYKDLRIPYKSPTAEEIFSMLIKETPETFYIGKLILCYVTSIARKKLSQNESENVNPIKNEKTNMWDCPFCMKSFPELSDVWSHFDSNSCAGKPTGVRVRLDNSLSGFIPTKLISDKHVSNPEDRVRTGMTLHARITKIDIERFAVDLTCRSSDLADKNNEWRPAKDPFYDYDAEEQDRKKVEDNNKKQDRQVYLKRVILHPSFKNITYKDAEAFLKTMDQGDVIIRPSSKSTNNLTVSWKVTNRINHHIDVREEEKENDFSLGRRLIIENETFEDLDEIIARHVQPMAAYAREVINYKHYRDANGGKKEEMEKLLKEAKTPKNIPYFLAASVEFPGRFLLSYLPRKKVCHEFVSLSPNGLRYRKREFRSVDRLIKWFKENFREVIPGNAPNMLSTRTPMGQSSCARNTPNLNLMTLDSQAIQRAAASLPDTLYNTLQQVACRTPGPYQDVSSSYTANYKVGYGCAQPYSPAQPVSNSFVTPSFHTVPTPAHSLVSTPNYGVMPLQDSAFSTTPTSSRSATQVKSSCVKPLSVEDLERLAQQWVQKKQENHNPTPMEESTPPDATPLIDEF